MRKIIIILLLLINICGITQTRLDTLIFNKINEYRLSKCLKELKWDIVAYKSSEHHTKYLVDKDFYSGKKFFEAAKYLPTGTDTIFLKQNVTYPHREDDVRFSTFGKRYEYYGGKCVYGGEVIGGNMACCKEDDLLKDDKLAKEVINGWKNSPAHNKILTDPVYTKGCGSTSIESIDQGFGGRKCYFIISTFMMIN